MANQKISDLTAGDPLANGDELVIARAGQNYKIAADPLVTAISGSLTSKTDVTITADSDANASGDIIFKAGTTEIGRFYNAGYLEAASQYATGAGPKVQVGRANFGASVGIFIDRKTVGIAQPWIGNGISYGSDGVYQWANGMDTLTTDYIPANNSNCGDIFRFNWNGQAMLSGKASNGASTPDTATTFDVRGATTGDNIIRLVLAPSPVGGAFIQCTDSSKASRWYLDINTKMHWQGTDAEAHALGPITSGRTTKALQTFDIYSDAAGHSMVKVGPGAALMLAGAATDTLGFYGSAGSARQVLATGAGKTVDNVITALQNLGLVSQT